MLSLYYIEVFYWDILPRFLFIMRGYDLYNALCSYFFVCWIILSKDFFIDCRSYILSHHQIITCMIYVIYSVLPAKSLPLLSHFTAFSASLFLLCITHLVDISYSSIVSAYLQSERLIFRLLVHDKLHLLLILLTFRSFVITHLCIAYAQICSSFNVMIRCCTLDVYSRLKDKEFFPRSCLQCFMMLTSYTHI